jgi:hypothetical protein
MSKTKKSKAKQIRHSQRTVFPIGIPPAAVVSGPLVCVTLSLPLPWLWLSRLRLSSDPYATSPSDEPVRVAIFSRSSAPRLLFGSRPVAASLLW